MFWRILKYFFFFAVLLFTLSLMSDLLMVNPPYPISDHFDGKRFFNPYGQNKSLWDVIQFFSTRDPIPWPEHIEITQKVVDPPHTNLGELRVTYINHATTLIQLDGVNILTDPIWSERASPFSWIGPKRVIDPGVKFEDLPPIDLVLISHNHYDHLDLPTLQRLQGRDQPLFLVPLGNKSYLEKHGMKHVEEMDWWQPSHFPKLQIHLVPSQHFSARWAWDRNRTLWGGFYIKGKNHAVYFAGDTGYSPFFQVIKERLGPPSLAILPIGAYLPRWFMSTHHISPEEAVQAYKDLEAKYALAIHFGTFHLTDEAYDAPQKDLKEALKQHGLSLDDFWILEPGEERAVND